MRCRSHPCLLFFAILAPGAIEAATISISPAAFLDDESNRTLPAPFGANHFATTSPLDGGIEAGYGDPWPVCVDAPLALPHGATITQLALWARDLSSSTDLVIELLRKPVGTADPPQTIAAVATSGSAAVVQITFAPVSHVVDRAHFAYSLRGCLGSQRLYNLVIDYDGPTDPLASRSPVVVHPAAFRETTGRAEAVHLASQGFAHSIWGQTEHLVAPLELPAGSEILRLEATLANPAADPFLIQLRRKRLNNLVPAEILAEVSSIALDGTVRTLVDDSVIDPIVEDDFHYYLVAEGMDGSSDQRIFDVTVVHTDVIFADAFETADTSRWTGPDAPPQFRTAVISSAAFRATWSAHSTANPPTFFTSAYDRTKGMLQLYPPPDPEQGEVYCSVAPIQLPDGATIVGWTLWGYDGEPSLDMTVELRRKRAIQVSGSSIIGSITSTGLTGDFGFFQALDQVVDNVNQHLYFSWCQHEDADFGDFGLIGIELYYVP